MLGWWNGRHWGLKIPWEQSREGSTPFPSIFFQFTLIFTKVFTGVLSVVVPVFMAKVIGIDSQNQEDTEAIEDILELTVEEAKAAFAKGYYEYNLRGKLRKVMFRDPFLAYALLRL